MNSVVKEDEDEYTLWIRHSLSYVQRHIPQTAEYSLIVQPYLGFEPEHRLRLRVWNDGKKKITETTKLPNGTTKVAGHPRSRTEKNQSISLVEFRDKRNAQKIPGSICIIKNRLKFPAAEVVDGGRPDIELDIFWWPQVLSGGSLILGEIEADLSESPVAIADLLPAWITDWEDKTHIPRWGNVAIARQRHPLMSA